MREAARDFVEEELANADVGSKDAASPPDPERSQLETDDEVWHCCRNRRCRTKLPAPVSNRREAFCTRGCYNSFYLRRCLICDRPIEQPKRGRRLICKRVRCRRAFRDKSCLGRYHTSSDAKLISKEADFVGLKDPLKPNRRWPILCGRALNA